MAVSIPASQGDGALEVKLGRAVGEGRPDWAAQLHERLVSDIAERVTRVRAQRAKGPLPTGYLWRVACIEAIGWLRRARAEQEGAPAQSQDPIDPERLWRVLRDDIIDKKLDKARRKDPALAEEFALARAFAEAADRDEAVTGVEMMAAEFTGDDDDDEVAPARPVQGSSGRIWLIVGAVAAAIALLVMLARG